MSTGWKRFFGLVVVGVLVGSLVGCNMLGSDDEEYVAAPAPITVLTHMTAFNGSATTAIAALNKFIALTRTEPGCLRYDAFQGNLYASGTSAANEFCLIEVWKDQDAINYHLGTSWFGEFFGAATSTYVVPAGSYGPFDVTAMITPLADKTPTPVLNYRFGQAVAATGQGTTVQNAMLNYQTSARAETGCVKFDLFQGMPANGTASTTFQVFAAFAGDSAEAYHLAAPHTTTFLTTVPPLTSKFNGFSLKRITLPAANIITPTPAGAVQPLAQTTDIGFYAAAMNRVAR